jgi:hypothetical protein
MLTLQLLRVRTRNGAIFPLFCTKEEDVELAKKIIQEFEQTWKNKEKKAVLEDRISAIEESDAGSDYKGDARSKVGIAVVTMTVKPVAPAPLQLLIRLALERRYLKSHQKGVLH